MTTTDQTARMSAEEARAAERAARWVPHHPKELCRNFLPQPIPSGYWCRTCGWNQTLHDDEIARKAIAAELDRLNAGGTETTT